MLAKITARLRLRTLVESDFLTALNREILPVLASVRDAINRAIGERTVEPMSVSFFAPAAPGTSYAPVDTFVGYSMVFQWQDDEFPLRENGRDRVVHFSGFVRMSAPTSAGVTVALYDVTAGTVVADSEITTSQTDFEAFKLGPLSMVDTHVYQVYAKRTDGTAIPQVGGAQIEVTYE